MTPATARKILVTAVLFAICVVIGPAILVRTFEWLSRTRADQWFVLGPLTIGTGLWLGITASIWESA